MIDRIDRSQKNPRIVHSRTQRRISAISTTLFALITISVLIISHHSFGKAKFIIFLLPINVYKDAAY